MAKDETTKKAIPRIVDSELEGPEPCVKIDVKSSTLPAALAFITKAFKAAGDPNGDYQAVTVKGVLHCFPK